jgi:hypothetical protein
MIRSTHTRRFPRYHVHLPVSIATDGDAVVVVPGLVSEISRSGMEVYCGVQHKPGELMEVEFASHGADTIRVAGVVRSRAGFCFGLEFLSLTTADSAIRATAGDGAAAGGQDSSLPLEAFDHRSPEGEATAAASNPVDGAEETLVELLLDRHEAYLRNTHVKIDRLRERALKIREFREEMQRRLRDSYAGRNEGRGD